MFPFQYLAEPCTFEGLALLPLLDDSTVADGRVVRLPLALLGDFPPARVLWDKVGALEVALRGWARGEEPRVLQPILIRRDPEGLALHDGRHRVEAPRRLGLVELPASLVSPFRRLT